ncbi:hypothetical protein ACHAWF_018886 [Thalassiosira exigua]
MSRPSALRATLGLPPSRSLEVVAVPATGDCFYDCARELLVRHVAREEVGVPSLEPRAPMLSRSRSRRAAEASPEGSAEGGRSIDRSLPSSQDMREYVAEHLASEQLESYQMYAAAGLGEYDYATGLTLEGLREYAKRSGRTRGPGECFWADEFALRTVSDGLRLTLLIVDDQATRGRGSGRGSKRMRNGDGDRTSSTADNRFVSIGSYPLGVIFHRSRRQHYNAVIVDGCPVVDLGQCSVSSLWPMIREAKTSAPSSENDSESGNAETKKRKANECISERENEGARKKVTSPENASSKLSDASEGKDSTAATLTESSSTQSPPSPLTPLGNFYCGCAGFSSSSWVGNFYPKSLVGHNSDRQLAHYQQNFRTVEINSTFYGIPSESTVNKWKGLISKSFKVVAKAPKDLTHEHTQLNCSVLSTFLKRMQPLDLACILIQCPRNLVVTVSQLEELKLVLDEANWYRGRIALELRNEAAYFDEKVRHFLKENSYALVMHPNSLGRSTVGTSASGRGGFDLMKYQPEPLSQVASVGVLPSNFVYLRLHGFNDEHRGEYSMDQLRDIANQIHSWRTQGLDVFCYILNDLEPTKHTTTKQRLQPWDKFCAMPKNAKQLESLVYTMSKEDVPDAPKKPKNTLHNFFTKK